MQNSPQGCPVHHPSHPGDNVLSTSSSLSTDRVVSSIPRTDSMNWVYPSEAQFFSAMARKQHNPRAGDMKTVVPIHNLVNERAWQHICEWECGQGGDRCGGIKLVSFQGKPQEPSLRARCLTLLGYSAPFDRHDWIVDRCGLKMRYIIDFYTGHNATNSPQISFYLDVRPALDNFEGVRMRLTRFWGKWQPGNWSSPFVERRPSSPAESKQQ